MGLFDRIAFITRSKANALLDDLEDPVQAIRLSRMRQKNTLRSKQLLLRLLQGRLGRRALLGSMRIS